MQPWKLILAYDGTPFHGWQVQPGLPTVQGALAAALHRIAGETLLPQGSGRTDTGVHALAQVATFDLLAPIPPANLLRALNRTLPASIRILSAAHAAPGFHARHSALRKTYEYRIFPRATQKPVVCPTLTTVPSSLGWASGAARPSRQATDPSPDRICPPTLAPYLWDCPWPLSLPAAQQAAQHILGEHDFTSFAAADPDLRTRHPSPGAPSQTVPPFEVGSSDSNEPRSTLRTIHYSSWTEQEGILIYRITGSGFLHHMVRNLVGTFIDAAANRISPDAIPQILVARNRAAAGPTAPARGLFLVSVEYPTQPEANVPSETSDHSPQLLQVVP